jgi:hypothetical protein
MMINSLRKNDEAVRRALVVLYKQQTAEEQDEHITIERNARGFNVLDALTGSRLARQVLSGQGLNANETRAARYMLMKYVKQLTELQNEGVGVSADIPKQNEKKGGDNNGSRKEDQGRSSGINGRSR